MYFVKKSQQYGFSYVWWDRNGIFIMYLFNPFHTHAYKQSKLNPDMIECFNDRWNNTNAASNVKLPVINEILGANFFLSKLTTAIVLYVRFRKVLNI